MNHQQFNSLHDTQYEPIPPPTQPDRPPTLDCAVCQRPGDLFCRCGFVAHCSSEHQDHQDVYHYKACRAIINAKSEHKRTKRLFRECTEDQFDPYDVAWFPQSRAWSCLEGHKFRQARWQLIKQLERHFIPLWCDRYLVRRVAWLYETMIPHDPPKQSTCINVACLYARLGLDSQAYAMLDYYFKMLNSPQPLPKVRSYRDILGSISDDNGLHNPLEDVRECSGLAIQPRLILILLRLRLLIDIQRSQNICSALATVQNRRFPHEIVDMILNHMTGPQLAELPDLCGSNFEASHARSKAIVKLRGQIKRLIQPIESCMWETVIHGEKTKPQRVGTPFLERRGSLEQQTSVDAAYARQNIRTMWHESDGAIEEIQKILALEARNQRCLVEKQSSSPPPTSSASMVSTTETKRIIWPTISPDMERNAKIFNMDLYGLSLDMSCLVICIALGVVLECWF